MDRNSRGILRIWDPTTGKFRHSISTQRRVENLVLTSDGSLIITVGLGERTIRIWDGESGKPLQELQGDFLGIKALALSPDDKILASANTNPHRVHLWEMATGKLLGHVQGHRMWACSLAFSPDGKLLASGGGDTNILLWDWRKALFGRHPEPANLTAKDLETLWTQLASQDAAEAYKAMRLVPARPAQVLPFLQKHLLPATAVKPERVAELLQGLDSRQPRVREKALRELTPLSPSIEPALRKALKETTSAEVRKQLERLLGQSWHTRSPELLRRVRAIQALEWLGSPEARDLLQRLAEGLPSARETREAQKALQRLKRPY